MLESAPEPLDANVISIPAPSDRLKPDQAWRYYRSDPRQDRFKADPILSAMGNKLLSSIAIVQCFHHAQGSLLQAW